MFLFRGVGNGYVWYNGYFRGHSLTSAGVMNSTYFRKVFWLAEAKARSPQIKLLLFLSWSPLSTPNTSNKTGLTVRFQVYNCTWNASWHFHSKLDFHQKYSLFIFDSKCRTYLALCRTFSLGRVFWAQGVQSHRTAVGALTLSWMVLVGCCRYGLPQQLWANAAEN